MAHNEAQAKDTIKPQDRDEQWVQVQIKGLSAWANSYLGQSKAKNVSKIENLVVDLKSGVKLNQLLEMISSKKLRYDITPKMKIQSIQNLSTAIMFIQADLGVRLVGIGAEDIYGGDLKLILGLLFSMFRHLRSTMLANELGDAGKGSSEAQQLIAWVQKQVAPAPYELKVADWSDFRDGKAFAALLSIYDEDFLDYKTVGDNGLENISRAFKGFEEHLAIPQLIDPKEVADGTADERSLTLYTSLIYHAHATAGERLRLKREAAQKEADLEAQRRAAEEARLRAQNMGGELESLRAENQRLLDELEAARRARDAEEAARRELNRQLEAEKNNVETLTALTDAVLEEKKANAFKLNVLSALNGENLDAVAGLIGVDSGDLQSGNYDVNVDPADPQALEDINSTRVENWETASIKKKAPVIRQEQADRRQKLVAEVNDVKANVKKEIKRRKALVEQVASLESALEQFEEKSLKQGQAYSALDVLKRNLLEHLEDLEQWRELYDVDMDPSKLSVYDENKVHADLSTKKFEEQVGYLSEKLQDENRTLTRILRVKDSKHDLEETVTLAADLFMKTEKKGGWTPHHFKLLAEDLVYYSDEKGENREGAVSLKEPNTTVTLLKPEATDKGEKLFPIKLKLTSGQQFYVATLTKKDRKDWAAVLNGRIVHFSYLAATEAQEVRPDTRVLNLCSAPADCPSVYFDNGAISTISLEAVAEILPFLENVNVVSFSKCSLTDTDIDVVGPGLGKGSIRILNLPGNNLTDEGAKKLATVLSTNKTVEELDLSNNQISNEGAMALSSLFSGKHPIKKINLEANKISNAGVSELCKGLAGAAGTTALRLGKNDIGDEGVIAIADLLRVNSTITEVQLQNNSISDEGVANLCDALADNVSVTKLDLSHNSVGPAGVASIHKLMAVNKSIRSIDVSGNDGIVEGAQLAKTLQNGGISLSSLCFSRNI